MRPGAPAACVLLMASLLGGCGAGGIGATRVPGSGTIVTESRSVPAFDRIALAGEGEVVVVAGDEPSLTVETDGNLLGHIETAVAGRTLEIATERGIDIAPSRGVVYRVTTPSVTGVTLSGAGSVALGRWAADEFSVVLSGAGDVSIERLDARSLDVVIAGAGRVEVAGRVETQHVTLPGAGSYEAAGLESDHASVSASGVGSAVLQVASDLDANVSGAGSIDYYGSPRVAVSVTGTGTITQLGAQGPAS